MPIEFNLSLGDDDRIFYISQIWPCAPRQGMPQDSLNFSSPFPNYFGS